MTWQACKALASKKGGIKPKDNTELFELAAGQLLDTYKRSASKQRVATLVQPVLDNLKP